MTCTGCRRGQLPKLWFAGSKPVATLTSKIMIPLVADVEELIRMREVIEEEVARAVGDSGIALHVPVGTMIELPGRRSPRD